VENSTSSTYPDHVHNDDLEGVDVRSTLVRRLFVKNFLFQLISMTVRSGYLFLLSILVARYWGAEVYGQYAALVAFMMVFRFAVDWGMNRMIVRQVARERENVTKFVSTSLLLMLIMASFAVVVIFAADQIADVSKGNKLLLSMASLWIILNVTGMFFSGVFYAFERMELDTWTVLAGFGVSLALIFIFLPNYSPSLVILMTIMTLGQLVNVLISVGIYLKYIGGFRPRINLALMRTTLVLAIPFGLQVLLQRESNLHIVFLNMFQGNLTTGYYRAAEAIALFPGLLSTLMGNVMYPLFSRAFQKSMGTFSGLLQKGIHYMLMSSLPVAIGIFILAEPILKLVYGSPYAASALYMRLLSLSLPLTFVGGILATTLTSADRQGQRTAVLAATAFIHLSLSLWLIPAYAAIGASIAVLLAYGFWFLMLLALTWRAFGWHYKVANARPILFASVLMTGIILLVSSWSILMIVLCAAIVYGATLLLADRVLQHDIRQLHIANFLRTIRRNSKEL